MGEGTIQGVQRVVGYTGKEFVKLERQVVKGQGDKQTTNRPLESMVYDTVQSGED